MVELGQLEEQHEAFASRGVRVLVVSMEGAKEAEATQRQFPHLVAVSDANRGLTGAVDAIHVGAGPDGGDIAMPTTLLVDGQGVVRWIFRPGSFLGRLSPSEMLAAIDTHLKK
jgi:alkyl hydroperoxide reductase subunit AhpC